MLDPCLNLLCQICTTVFVPCHEVLYKIVIGYICLYFRKYFIAQKDTVPYHKADRSGYTPSLS
jgi:hypothetical protein